MAHSTISDFLKGRYNLIIYVGINIDKLNHFASAISSDSTELMKLFKFSNDGYGFHMLSSRLSSLSYEDNNIIIVLESTAYYSDNLARRLVACNYNVCVEFYQNLGHA